MPLGHSCENHGHDDCGGHAGRTRQVVGGDEWIDSIESSVVEVVPRAVELRVLVLGSIEAIDLNLVVVMVQVMECRTMTSLAVGGLGLARLVGH